MYVLASVEPDGTIRATDTDRGAGWSSVVHRETVGVHTWGGACYSTLSAAKEKWEANKHVGPESEVLLELSLGEGAPSALWMTDLQKEALVPLLNKWRGCYGRLPIRKLNA